MSVRTRAYLIGKLYRETKQEQGGDRGNQYTVASSHNGNLAKTAEGIADQFGVGETKQEQGGTGANRFTPVQSGHCVHSVTTAEDIADQFGVGKNTVRRADCRFEMVPMGTITASSHTRLTGRSCPVPGR